MILRGTDSRVRDCGHREAVGAATQDQHLTLAASWWRHASRRSLHGQRARCAGTAWGGPVRAGRSVRTVCCMCLGAVADSTRVVATVDHRAMAVNRAAGSSWGDAHASVRSGRDVGQQHERERSSGNRRRVAHSLPVSTATVARQ